ncbi:MAG: hypothetical protein II843_01535 [Alphaproteobacteria bacterium]|nr:hypothetical protein [Alphaproteobacteria bacterium]
MDDKSIGFVKTELNDALIKFSQSGYPNDVKFIVKNSIKNKINKSNVDVLYWYTNILTLLIDQQDIFITKLFLPVYSENTKENDSCLIFELLDVYETQLARISDQRKEYRNKLKTYHKLEKTLLKTEPKLKQQIKDIIANDIDSYAYVLWQRDFSKNNKLLLKNIRSDIEQYKPCASVFYSQKRANIAESYAISVGKIIDKFMKEKLTVNGKIVEHFSILAEIMNEACKIFGIKNPVYDKEIVKGIFSKISY